MSQKKRGLKKLYGLGILLFSCSSGWTAPELEVTLEPSNTVRVNKTCRLDIHLSWKSQEPDYYFPQPNPLFERLVVEKIGETSEAFQKEGETWRKKTFHFDLKALQAGVGRIHSFRLDYLDPATQVDGHFEVPARELRIVPDRTRLYQGGAVTLGLLASVGFLGRWVFLRRMKKKREAASRLAEPTLEERWISQLTRLKEKGREAQATQNDIFEMGRLFRFYLGEKYSIAGTFVTSLEMISELQGKVPLEELKSLKKIFDKLDEWRYAGPHQSRSEWENLYREMCHYVEGKRIVST